MRKNRFWLSDEQWERSNLICQRMSQVPSARTTAAARCARGRGQGAGPKRAPGHQSQGSGSLIPRILWQFLIHLKVTSEEGLQRIKAVQRHLSPFAFGGDVFLGQ
jgi:hypothetical protein